MFKIILVLTRRVLVFCVDEVLDFQSNRLATAFAAIAIGRRARAPQSNYTSNEVKSKTLVTSSRRQYGHHRQRQIELNVSTKYPSLHPLLAEDTSPLKYDLRHELVESIPASDFLKYRISPAQQIPTRSLEIVSKDFPWQINIISDEEVTCGDVWQALYLALQEPIRDSEWGLMMMLEGEARRAIIADAEKKRFERDPSGERSPKRIDSLGDKMFFAGLGRDDEFSQMRHLPYSLGEPETWVVKLVAS
ncbi:hypothetical protein NLJ89_g8646 [Agrocybe chaxingu]|uniref:DUF6699 domain-containing protein n=1 Tax=Agrocybe chaxingu TaxID=84603 RepID=A0A9W8MTW6_9AGAR|nr:hypothetical protein NLJ89_g8646 [Agrocybe chaxingu]